MSERMLVLCLFSLLAAALFITAMFGRLYVKSGITQEMRDGCLRLLHTLCATSTLILMVFAVASVGWLKQHESPIEHGIVLTVHLLFAVPFALLFVFLFFFFTGIRTPSYHRTLVYPCLALFAVAFIAGTAMLLGIA